MKRPRLIIACFCLLGLFPAIYWLTLGTAQTLTGLGFENPLDEKRHRVLAPTWTDSSLFDYLQGWQAWFNDRYAGRALLIRTKNQIDYSLFNYNDRVHLGRDGWLFPRWVLDEQKPVFTSATDAQFDAIVQNIARLKTYLAQRGITLLLTDIENKEEFYPEKLPADAPRQPDSHRYAALRQRLATETGAIFIDSSALLRRIQPHTQLFFRTDFHWTHAASLEIAKAIVEEIAHREGRHSPAWQITNTFSLTRFSGGDARLMPTLWPIEEQIDYPQVTWRSRPHTLTHSGKDCEFAFRQTDSDDPALLPPLVIFGDSFSGSWNNLGFRWHFRSLTMYHHGHTSLQAALTSMPADTKYFLLEFVDVSVWRMAQPFLAAP